MRKGILLSIAGATLLFILAVALSGCLEEEGGNSFENAAFSMVVSGCAETAQGMTTKSPGEFEERQATLKVKGKAIVYDRAIEHLCCRKAEISKEFGSGNGISAITIHEDWSGQGCKCMCYSELGARIEGLEPGLYHVKVVERGKEPDGSQVQESIVIEGTLQVPVEVKAPATATVYFQPMQCEPLPWESEESIKAHYASELGVSIVSVESVCPQGRMVCQACSVCPTQCYFKAVVAEEAKEAMLEEGWLEETPA